MFCTNAEIIFMSCFEQYSAQAKDMIPFDHADLMGHFWSILHESCDLPHETPLGKIERCAEIRELDLKRQGIAHAMSLEKSYSREPIPLLTWGVGVRRPAAWAWDWSWNPGAPGTSGLWTRLHKQKI